MTFDPQAPTLPHVLQEAAWIRPHAVAYARRVDGSWTFASWQDVWREVRQRASMLRGLGLARGDRLAILAKTRFEWQIAEMAGLCAGAVIVGAEAHAPAEQLAFVLDHAEVNALIVENLSDLATVLPHSLRRLKFIVYMGGAEPTDLPGKFVAWGAKLSCQEPRESDVACPDADDPAELIYTAGTTGAPKGILYTHAQILAGCRAIRDAFPQLSSGDSTICWLPMAHLFQRMMNFVAMMTGVKTYFVEDPREVLARIQEIHPTVFIAVPRFYEKLVEGIQHKLAEQAGVRKRLIEWTLAVGRRRIQAISQGKRISWPWRLAHALLDWTVARRIRRVMGGESKLLISGSAPSALWQLEFLDAIGLRVLEAYGLSENTVPLAANRPDDYRLGSVGKPLAGNVLRIAEDGEILVKGAGGLFRGYYKNEQVPFTADGFYPTGDFGRLDSDGFLFLDGRKSEIIKTSTGRRISPARIETVYRRCSHLDHVVVVGDGRKHLTALVTVKTEGPNSCSMDPESLREIIHGEMELAGSELAPHERIRAFAMVPRALSVAAGELTPTLKLCRKRIADNHAALIDRLYEAEEFSPRVLQPRNSAGLVLTEHGT